MPIAIADDLPDANREISKSRSVKSFQKMHRARATKNPKSRESIFSRDLSRQWFSIYREAIADAAKWLEAIVPSGIVRRAKNARREFVHGNGRKNFGRTKPFWNSCVHDLNRGGAKQTFLRKI